jgi:hypothetical protein
MALLGVVLIVRSRRKPSHTSSMYTPPPFAGLGPHAWQQLVFSAVLAFCLLIPSNWTQDVPARYGKRHVGLTHSWIYPELNTAPRLVK